MTSGDAHAGNGLLQRVRDNERRTARLEGRVDRIEDGDQQAVILERLAHMSAEAVRMRAEITWLRRTIIGLAATIAAAAAFLAQLVPSGVG